MSSLSSKSTFAGLPNQVPTVTVQVPTVATDLFARTGQLFQISITNGSGSDRTITLLDKQPTPRAIMRTTTIPNGTTVCFNWAEGIVCTGGLNWVASGTGLEAQLVAFFGN